MDRYSPIWIQFEKRTEGSIKCKACGDVLNASDGKFKATNLERHLLRPDHAESDQCLAYKAAIAEWSRKHPRKNIAACKPLQPSRLVEKRQCNEKQNFLKWKLGFGVEFSARPKRGSIIKLDTNTLW